MGRKVRTALIIILALVMAFGFTAFADEIIKANTGVNIRASASTKAKIKGTIPDGACIVVYGEEDGWYFVDGGRVKTGYADVIVGEPKDPSQDCPMIDLYTKNMVFNNDGLCFLTNHYLGMLERDTMAYCIQLGRYKVIPTGFQPIFDIIEGYAYFAYAEYIYRLDTIAFSTMVPIGDDYEIVAAYKTFYSSSSSNRKHNIWLVSTKIDGKIVPSGKEFSYNDTTGKRDAKAGYKEATVFNNGKKEQGIGGGVCQVSSTIYSAIFQNDNFTIKERHAHSLPVEYLPKGMDATVSYPKQNLRFRNDCPFDVEFVASADGRGLLIMIVKAH